MHSPIVILLQRMARHRIRLSFATGECIGLAIGLPMANGECKTTLYPFQLICATVKGNLERPLEVSCLLAQEVEAALEARLISTTVGPGASTVNIDTSTVSSSRSQCFKNLFCLSILEKLMERERE